MSGTIWDVHLPIADPKGFFDQMVEVPKGVFQPANLRQGKGQIFYSLAEAKIIIESCRRHYNTKRPHSSLGCGPPVPEVVQSPTSASGAASLAIPTVAPRPAIH
jgi:Integrase core domain